MDREQEDLQFLGLFGIYREGYKIVVSWRRILSQITLTLILPLCFIFLAHMEISTRLFWKIRDTEWQLYRSGNDHQKHKRLADVLSSEWTYYYLFKAFYFTCLLVFSLLSTAAVVYTIACIYTARDVTFKKVMSVVPRVWKRLMVTFVISFAAFFVYNFISFLIIISCVMLEGLASMYLFIAVFIIYAIGFVYMTMVWQLASVVTVLEDSYGFKAMIKSKNLIKGNMWVSLIIFFKLNFALVGIQIVFQVFVVHGYSVDPWKKILLGIMCFLLLIVLILFWLVAQTIIYFVCKSYHHENIDKSSLSDHLEVYLGEYEPLKSKDLQLEHYEV